MDAKMVKQFILLVLALSAGGCHLCKEPQAPLTPNIGSHLRQSSTPIRRVAVLPIECNVQDRAAAKLLQDSLIESLRQRGAFEIVEVDQTLLGPCSPKIVENGIYDERQLVWLMRRFNVDAVMYSRLNHARQVIPQSISAICHIVDARESYVIATAEGGWDLSFPADKERFNNYVRLNDMDFLELDLAQQSVQAMTAFVGEEIAMKLY